MDFLRLVGRGLKMGEPLVGTLQCARCDEIYELGTGGLIDMRDGSVVRLCPRCEREKNVILAHWMLWSIPGKMAHLIFDKIVLGEPPPYTYDEPGTEIEGEEGSTQAQ